jgi:hypothetical protein
VRTAAGERVDREGTHGWIGVLEHGLQGATEGIATKNRQQAMIGNGHPVGVAAQIAQHLQRPLKATSGLRFAIGGTKNWRRSLRSGVIYSATETHWLTASNIMGSLKLMCVETPLHKPR